MNHRLVKNKECCKRFFERVFVEEDEEKSCDIADYNGDTLINEQRNYIK